MLAMTIGAIVVSSILYICALVAGVIGPWDAAALGFAGTFYVIAVPAMLNLRSASCSASEESCRVRPWTARQPLTIGSSDLGDTES
jgi:hypothetical protein